MKLIRKKSVLLLVVMSFTIFNAYAENAAGSLCSGKEDEAVGDGSESLIACVRFTEGKIKTNNALSSSAWSEFMKKNYECCTKKDEDAPTTAEGTGQQVDPVLAESCQKKVTIQAQKCASISNILRIHHRDWDNSEHTERVTNRSSRQAPQQAPGTNVAGSNIVCVSEGIETLDYTPCKKFVDAYVAAEAATQMVHAGQSVMLQGKLMDVEADMIKNQNSATGALEAQTKGLKEQANVYSQRAALDASKLGILYNLYAAIPKKKDLEKDCSDVKLNLGTLNNQAVSAAEKECKDAVNITKSRFALLQNQAALDAMKAQLMTAAVSTANNAILSKLTNDRAKDAKKAIADINEFQPTDPFKIATEEEKTTLCEKDPSNKKCTDIGLDANYDAISDNTIVFGNTGGGSSYTGSEANDNQLPSGSNDESGTGAVVPSIGTVIADVDKSGSIESSSAATVSSKANGGSASGGGGSGGGGGGSLGGQTPQKPGEGGVTAAVASKAPAYSGGDGFSVTGGLGIRAKKSGEKSDENPFGKLFGKDGNKASDVNFRDIASNKVGAKGENIFDMISKRYGAVNSEKRLVEYELAR